MRSRHTTAHEIVFALPLISGEYQCEGETQNFTICPFHGNVELDRFGDKKRGWGSLPVEVTVGTTTWKTSIFPDTKANAYLLPIKADVRKKEGIAANTSVTLLLEIRV
jgi:hypothetical protein